MAASVDHQQDVVAKKQRLSTAYLGWKDIKFAELMAKADKEGLEIGNQQERAATARKQLAEMTRNYKKADPTEQQTLLTPLMRAYQNEIDLLGKRAKTAETAFLDWYKQLYEAPDPIPAFALGLEIASRVFELESELKRSQDQLQHAMAELQTLNNQDLAVRRLDQRVRELETEMDTRVQAEVEKRHAELREAFNRSDQQVRERERQLRYQLETAEHALNNSRLLHERAQQQLLLAQSKRDVVAHASQSEADILQRELAAVQERLAIVESERDALQSRTQQSPLLQRVAGEAEQLQHLLSQKDEQIDDLLEQLRRVERTSASEREKHINAIQTLQRDAAERQRSVEQLQQQVASSPSTEQFAELQRQLKMLKALQFNMDAEDTEDSVPGAGSMGFRDNPMVSMLAQKNRRLEDELAHLRVALEERQKLLASAENQLADYREHQEKQTALIKKLEADLSQRATSPVFSLALEQIPDLDQATDRFVHEEPTMLDIVTGQRDRFKARIVELETQNRTLQQQLDTQVFELESVKSDNLKLYKKVRYLESYRAGSDDLSVVVQPNDIEDVETRYRPIYEQQLDPFTRFNRQEKVQRVQKLGFSERMALTGGRFVLANKVTRSFAFFYAITLHVLVFITLYRLAHCGS
eukprot:TRINITY_DN6685_c0_g2_i1.p1 TRINITY_DN6685_c0_g2~~TRINITY_DN6685_c0_g2_i1.p1  ORF type:complete len:642 (-),score=188.97 TRINITY_DN6685_c0_g2_i1:17-1942(-)